LLLIADHLTALRTLPVVRPHGPGSALIVINQSPAFGQLGDDLVELPPLATGESLALLTSIAGRSRAEADLSAAERLVRLCGGNPLVLSAVARWMMCRPRVPVIRLVRELEADPHRISRLSWSGRCLEDSVRERVRRLSDTAAEALAVLSLDHEARLSAVATRLSREPQHLEPALEELANAHLVDEVNGDEFERRFRLHRMARLVSPQSLLGDEA
jgi:hypothetical protein